MIFDINSRKYISFDIETVGLIPTQNRLTCICARDENGVKFKLSNIVESWIILNFYNYLEHHKTDEYYLLSKNGKMFDIPYIIIRAMINVDKGLLNLSMEEILSILNYDHFDIHEITKKWVSLDDFARILGVQGKSGDGLNAIKLWYDGKLGELSEYCMDDVECNISVFLKYMELQKGLI